MYSPPQVPTLGQTMDGSLLFDLERSVGQQSALLLQWVKKVIFLNLGSTTHTTLREICFTYKVQFTCHEK